MVYDFPVANGNLKKILEGKLDEASLKYWKEVIEKIKESQTSWDWSQYNFEDFLSRLSFENLKKEIFEELPSACFGVVMAKGVVFGVIGCVTILPSMILAMDKWIEKTRHKAIIPDLGRIGGFVTKHYWIFIILFLVIIGPAFYGQNHNQVYYDLMGTLPDNLELSLIHI